MIPGLFRTLVGLVVAWFVFRFLDRMFGRRRSAQGGRNARGSRGPTSSSGPAKQAKDDHLGEYVDYEEVEGKD
ncbi:MAG: hypothetical protein CL849_02320 [Crocinitomicaceae bacterium]|nr:hypothetical protein [Crocinitomicaceae bacterium]